MPSRRARLTLALGSSWYCSYTSTYGYVYTGGSGGGATKREFVAWSAERPGLEGGPRVSGERKAWSRIIFIPHSRLRGYVRIIGVSSVYHRCIIGKGRHTATWSSLPAHAGCCVLFLLRTLPALRVLPLSLYHRRVCSANARACVRDRRAEPPGSARIHSPNALLTSDSTLVPRR